MTDRREEWHVTVSGVAPGQWHAFCEEQRIKPLFIELNNRALQLMCELREDPETSGLLETIAEAGWKVERIKHEVSALRPGEEVVYYECHVKFDGPFRADRRLASRDLFRTDRWYQTRRSPTPFVPEKFASQAALLAKGSKLDHFEYEICIRDTNPRLDDGWYEATGR